MTEYGSLGTAATACSMAVRSLLSDRVDQNGEELVAVAETLVEVALGQAGADAHGFHRRARGAFAGQDVVAGFDQSGAPVGAPVVGADASVWAGYGVHI